VGQGENKEGQRGQRSYVSDTSPGKRRRRVGGALRKEGGGGGGGGVGGVGGGGGGGFFAGGPLGAPVKKKRSH